MGLLGKEGVRGMWISKKKWEALEKRVADLEGLVQSQLTYDSRGLEKSLKGIIQRHREAIHDNVPKPS